MEASGTGTEDELRKQARERLQSRRAFWGQLAVYVIVNAAFVIIWLVTKDEGNQGFWPLWIMGFWGIGLIFQAWNVFGAKPISEADVDREVEKLR